MDRGLGAGASPAGVEPVRGVVPARLRYVLSLVVLCAAYVGSAELGFAMAFVGGNVSAVWLPSGLAVAALLIGGARLAPAFWLGALLATAGTGAPLATAAAIATGNTLEYLAAYVLLRRIAGPGLAFERVGDVLALVLAAAVTPVLSALPGTAALCLGGVAPWALYWTIAETWWLGDAAGLLLVTPLVVSWVRTWPRYGTRRLGELAVMGAAAALATVAVFGGDLWAGTDDHVSAYLIFPFLVWGALRLGARGATAAVLCVNVPAIVFTAQGMGLFARIDLTQSLLLLQAFMTVGALTALVTAAAVAERNAAHARARLLSHAVEQSATTVMITDPAGRLTYVNRAFTDLTGYSARDVIGANPRFLKSGHTSDADYEALWAAITAGHVWRGEFLNRKADGGTLWEQATISPVRDDAGHITHFIGTKEDITARKAAEDGMRRALAKVERAKSELERVAYAVTHTLQEPLRGIGGFTQLIDRRYGDRLDDEGRGYLRRVLQSTERMQRLFRDLMDYTLIDQATEPDRSVDLTVIAERVVSELNAQGRVTLDPLPVVQGNAGQLRHLLSHLVGNGLTYHPPERPSHVTVSTRREAHGWCITVADDGLGIAPQYVDRLFNLFVRLHTEQEFSGSGVGLAYCRRVAERHGGSIGLESEPGRGTRIHVRLPFDPHAPAGVAPAPAEKVPS